MYIKHHFEELTTIEEVGRFIGNNPQHFIAYVDKYRHKINDLLYTYDSTFIKECLSVYGYYHNNDNITGDNIEIRLDTAMMSVLRAYTCKLCGLGSTDMGDFYDIVALLTLNSDELITAGVIPETYQKLYTYLMDMYLPTMSPDIIVEIASQIEWYKQIFSNREFLPEYIRSVKAENVNEYDLISDIHLLCRKISDLVKTRDSRQAEFGHIYRYIKQELGYRGRMDTLIDRYQKYLGENAENYIAFLASAYTIPYDRYLYRFTSAVYESYEQLKLADLPYEVIMSFFRDVNTQLGCLCDDDYKYRDYTARLAVIIESKFSTELFDEIKTNGEALLATVEASRATTATEAYSKTNAKMHNVQHSLYKAYRNYKDKENVIDSQMSKMVDGAKKMVTGDVKAELIEGKKFSIIGILKKCLGTAAIFNFSKIGAICLLITRFGLRKKAKRSERMKIIQEIDVELQLIDEKIDDARGDGDRDAKYALMRTKAELKKTSDKLKYGFEADDRSLQGAKQALAERS